jgi:hypothetical protein
VAITLGKDQTGANAPPFGGSGIISASFSQECETIDISNRGNIGGTSGGVGRKAFKAGFTKKTWEIETHDATGLVTSLEAAGSSWSVMSITENIGVDGAITFNVTALEFT